MHVEAKDLAQQRVHVLAVVELIVRAAAVAECGIEETIGAKSEPSAFVVRGAIRLVDRNEQCGGGRVDDVQVRRRHLVPADLRVPAQVGQVDVDVSVLGKARIEGKAEKALLAHG